MSEYVGVETLLGCICDQLERLNMNLEEYIASAKEEPRQPPASPEPDSAPAAEARAEESEGPEAGDDQSHGL